MSTQYCATRPGPEVVVATDLEFAKKAAGTRRGQTRAITEAPHLWCTRTPQVLKQYINHEHMQAPSVLVHRICTYVPAPGLIMLTRVAPCTRIRLRMERLERTPRRTRGISDDLRARPRGMCMCTTASGLCGAAMHGHVRFCACMCAAADVAACKRKNNVKHMHVHTRVVRSTCKLQLQRTAHQCVGDIMQWRGSTPDPESLR